MQLKPKPIRNLFLTTTAIGIYLTLCGVFVSAAPNIRSLLSRNQSLDKQADIADVIAIATGVVGAAGALIGRYNAGGVYTPNGLPGKDKIPTLPPDINN
jgi:hypothetical protein